MKRLALAFLALAVLAAPALAQGTADYAKTRRSVVLVLGRMGEDASSGTGFAVTREGRRTVIATCWHVVQGASELAVRTDGGAVVPARLRAQAAGGVDLALLTIEDASLPLLPLAGPARVGQEVGVIGFPRAFDFMNGGLGLEPSLSKGIVSALRPGDGGVPWLQVDAAVNEGNSGGPAVDWKTGRVVGVATAKLREAEGLNLLIASEAVRALLRQEGLTESQAVQPTSQRQARRTAQTPVPQRAPRPAKPIPSGLVMLALIVVLGAIGAGLWAVLRGGSGEPRDPGPAV